jgi:sulfatase-like protein
VALALPSRLKVTAEMSEDTSMSTATDVEHQETSARPLILWILPLIGAVVAPALWMAWAERPLALRPRLVLLMTGFVAVFAIALFGALSRGFRSRLRWATGVTSMAVIVMFQWGVFVATGLEAAKAVGLPFLADIIPVVFAGSLLWIASRLANEFPFAVIMSVATVVIVGALGFASYSLVAPAPLESDVTVAAPGSPDVLLLVLDGYARADWLEQNYSFDNTPFLRELEARGFVVASQATANYSYTYGSLSSMLNLDYVFLPDDIEEEERKRMRAALSGAAGIIPDFKQAGYEITFFENAWGGSLCGSAIDWCIRDGLVARAFWNVSQMTILAPVARATLDHPFTSGAAENLRSLGGVVATANSARGPRFTFAHILLPHSPLLLDAECKLNRMDNLRAWGSGTAQEQAERRANYIGQLQCANQRVLTALDLFLEDNPDGIVMISADHGPASTLANDVPADQQPTVTIRERMVLLSAYRLPGCESTVRQNLTPVNGTRLLVNCALGKNLPPVPDTNYWITLDADGELVELSLDDLP